PVIYVTHDQVEAMTMGSRIAVMRDGILQQLETPQVLYDSPSNTFVAGFIGSPAMNFFEGRISANGADTMYVESNSLKLEIPEGRRDSLKPHTGRDVILGIRPEDIHHVAERPNALDGQRGNVMVEVV